MAKARILIVDDEESTRELFARAASALGIRSRPDRRRSRGMKIAAETHPRRDHQRTW